MCVLQAHSNEMVRSVRHKISRELKCPPEQVQIMVNYKMVSELVSFLQVSTKHTGKHCHTDSRYYIVIIVVNLMEHVDLIELTV